MKTVTIKKPEKTNVFEIENGDQLNELIGDGEYPFLLFESNKSNELYPIVRIQNDRVYAAYFDHERKQLNNPYYLFEGLSQKIVIFSHEELGELAKKP